MNAFQTGTTTSFEISTHHENANIACSQGMMYSHKLIYNDHFTLQRRIVKFSPGPVNEKLTGTITHPATKYTPDNSKVVLYGVSRFAGAGWLPAGQSPWNPDR